MSYSTITKCVNDQAFVDRVTSCIAQEQVGKGEAAQPGGVLHSMLWVVATASDVEQAYAYALQSGNQNPGGDESVITDGMILSHVQANWPGDITPAPHTEPR